MASRLLTRKVAARPLASAIQAQASRTAIQLRYASGSSDAAESDPGMNGGYVNPPAIKRQFRDPYENWWDKQERRNFGEPVHEDNDIMGVFSPEEYTHYSPRMAFALIGCFCLAVAGLVGAVQMTYPDRPAVPRDYPNGLEAELGGPVAVRARKAGDPIN